MSIAVPRALCLVMHDVAEPTWPRCERLLASLREVADVPVTLLVSPRFHHAADPPSTRFIETLRTRAARGDELALHGWFHQDAQPVRGPVDRVRRRFYTRSEGEFSSLDAGGARDRIALGRDWFARHDLQASGFVAPAWLLNDDAWRVLADEPFRYTTSLNRLWLMPRRVPVHAPCLTYSTATAWRRVASRWWLDRLAARARDWPIVRLGLHPSDVDHPQVVAHWRALLERLLPGRTPMTKAALAATLAADAPA